MRPAANALVAEASLYLFDGFNLLHASPYADPRGLVDALASYVATQGARGIVVFDGVGEDAELGPLSVRYAPSADTLLERLAAQFRARERVILVSSDVAVIETAGRDVGSLSSQTFFRDFRPAEHRDETPSGLADRLDAETKARLERLRRGE